MRTNRFLTVLRGVDDVAPVENGGHAVVQGLDDPGPGCDVDVLRGIADRQVRPDVSAEVTQHSVNGNAPDRLVPEVAVGVDQARHDDLTFRVEYLRIGFDVGGNRDDHSLLGEQVPAAKRPHSGIETDDRATPDQETSAHRPLP
jgi:hypothetical protein